MAAVAIVAVSLVLSGVVTGYLVRQLEYQDAQDQLAKNGVILRAQILTLECGQRVNGRCSVTSPSEFVDSLNTRVADLNLGDDRLILLDKPPRPVLGAGARQARVLYDSTGDLAPGSTVPLGTKTRVIAGLRVVEGSSFFEGQDYLYAGLPLGTAGRFVSTIILARPQAVVAARTTAQLVNPLMRSAGIALLLAIVVSLLLSRAFTRPLRELQRAAEDIASGNYSRRVRMSRSDEIGVVGQAFDRMAEAVERSRSQQRAFLANVSHELKTPLTSLIGFSQALMDGSLRTDEDKMRAAAILNEEAERVLRMSQELLDLARVEAGQLALNLHPVDLGVQLHQEIEIFRSRAQQRGLVLHLDAPAALPPVQADPDRLHQILENLLDNAVKYAPEQTRITISAEESPGGRVTTVVRNRLGSRPPDPQRMFDRFYRGDPSRSSAGGVGLGLAICRELAVAQDGDLTAELEPDGGLCMRLDLPAALQPTPPAEQPSRLPGRLTPRPQFRGS